MIENDILQGLLELKNENIDFDIEQKIGEMLVIGFPKSDDGYIDAEYLNLIQSNHIGSVILFRHNIESNEQLKNLTSKIHDANPNCIIFVDQEGGKVQRLNFTSYPTAKEIVQKYSPQEAKDIYFNMAKELKEYNINANFGPLIDIDNLSAPCPVIGGLDRSYSDNPNIVIEYANSFIDAHRDNQIITCIKHFPGHGYANSDSHLGFVDVTETYNEIELIPYYKLIEENKVDMIMTAHILNKNFDPLYPATLSKPTLQTLLRDKYYDGIIVSDDLQMGAILDHYLLGESVVKAINAGCDMIIFSNNPLACPNINNFIPDSNIVYKVIDIIKSAIDSGEININHIDKSYGRIRKLKSKFV